MNQEKEYIDSVFCAAKAVKTPEIRGVLRLLENAYRSGRSVFVIGNGGSAANASHLTEDLAKGALQDTTKKRFRVLSLVDNTPFLTAVANDLGYERVFEFQLKQFARGGDVLIAISGSGNSPNIVRAVKCARTMKVKVVGVTGFGGGKLRKLADYPLHVPCNDMCKSEAVHAVLFHMIVDLLREKLVRRNA